MSKILLVDDDTELTELLSQVLAISGFTVDIANNGQEALLKLDSSYQLVLLDVMMPVLNGIETLKAIRKVSDIPVMMLTARGEEIDRVLGLELGADDYLPKPFNDRELVARIKAILRRSTPTTNSNDLLNNPLDNIVNEENESSLDDEKIDFHGLELYPKHQRATYNGKDLNLTTSEFALFYRLIHSNGEIISREELSVEVLGKKLTPFDRSVDMHMSNLRKKLPERDDNLPWFKTLRGKGYLLIT